MTAKTRTALVTGASRGIGLETCRELERRSFRVIATSRSGEGGYRLDVADTESIAALAAQLRKEGVTLDLLINNAGASMNGFNADVARRTLETNFFGAMHVTDALLDIVVDGGSIVMVSSMMGEISCVSRELQQRFVAKSLTREELVQLANKFVDDVAQGRHTQEGWPSSAYRVSKVCMNALVRVMAPQLSTRGIRVNAVCPGWVRSDMGGSGAPRSLKQGAGSVVATALDETGATGGFYRDGARLNW